MRGGATRHGHRNKVMGWISPCAGRQKGLPKPLETQSKAPKSCHHNPTPVTGTSKVS